MSLKEFDAKQFLLEKGEQVGLGIAVTLMVLMLIFSLFMPSKGFLSGSPAEKTKPLVEGTDRLQSALSNPSNKPTKPEDVAPDTTDRKIDLDTNLLRLDQYGTAPWFEPSTPENPARRPPKILTLVEAVAEHAFVPVETYIFQGKDFDKVLALRDPNKGKAAVPPAGPAGGGRNPLRSMYQASARPMPGGPMGGPMGQSANLLQRTRGQFNPNLATAASGILGINEKPEYKPEWVNFDNSGSEMLARQLRPARMVIIAGSFPYKEQLKEFQQKLHLESIQKVFDETVEMEDKETGKKESMDAFRFLGVDVERREVDVSGNPVEGKAGEWAPLPLAESYKIWLLNSGLPFEKDDPKYDPVKCPGLMAPLLREFHPERPQNQMMGMGMMGMRPPGMPAPAAPGVGPKGEMPGQETPKPAESKYPDVAGKLKYIQDTLAKLEQQEDSRKIVTIPRGRAHEGFNPFDPDAPTLTADKAAKKDKNKTGNDKVEEADVPEYCLVRLVDVNVDPGKSYQYRFKVRMVNPNYGKDDVASAAYKKEESLESPDWWQMPQTVTVPPETIYYAVDEYQLDPNWYKKIDKNIDRWLWDMWKERTKSGHVCLQLHRWVEKMPIGDVRETLIGDWAIADRVWVARGESIGRPVKVDLPVWKFAQDSYTLPAEDQKNRKRSSRVNPSGVEVNFGEGKPENETILLDFEGGKVSDEAKHNDSCALEVLMLSPDGKLVARNSGQDSSDKERKERREKFFKRIVEVRLGKTAGGGVPAAGGGLDSK